MLCIFTILCLYLFTFQMEAQELGSAGSLGPSIESSTAF